MINKYILFTFWLLTFPVHGETLDTSKPPEFVGYEGCKMCHRDQYADWEKSKHAKAFELLKPGNRVAAKKKAELDPDKDYTTSIKCLKCHTTGYRETGGFVNLTDTRSRAGMGCEMCHGPGSEYRKIHKQKHTGFSHEEVMAAGQVYGSEDTKICKRCHEHEDTPMKPTVDEKYVFHLEERLKNTRSYHKHYD